MYVLSMEKVLEARVDYPKESLKIQSVEEFTGQVLLFDRVCKHCRIARSQGCFRFWYILTEEDTIKQLFQTMENNWRKD